MLTRIQKLFKCFVKEECGCEVKEVPKEDADTFESVFGISFTKNVVVKDKEKIKEIKECLDNDVSSFDDIKPYVNKDNTKEVSKIWFGKGDRK